MIKKHIIMIMLGLGLALPVFSQAQTAAGFDKGLYTSKKDTLPYRILMPQNFDPQQKYPLLIVLHGAGERGTDNEAQLKYGTGLLLSDSVRQKYPAIVIFPQCPADSYWSNVKITTDSLSKKRIFNFTEGGEPTKAMAALLGLVHDFLDKPYVDQHRVYIGGLSMGGMGTYEILRRKPKVFAAAFAICGGGNINNAKTYAKKVPMWLFHGEKDDTVPVEHTKAMYEAIKAAGGNPRLTLYPNDGHNSWNDAFAEPDFLQWVFAHRR